MPQRHPIKRVVRCEICGSRRRTDGRRIVTVSKPTWYVKGNPPQAVKVEEGAKICWWHDTVEVYEANERLYGREPWTR